jgi:hypothetical protein
MPLRIGKWIRGWRLDKFFNRIFGSVNDFAKELAPVAIGVVQCVKKFVDSPIADVITSIIPGNIDDRLKEKLRAILPDVIIKMQLVDTIANIEDRNEQLKAILEKLKLSSDEAQNVFYHGLASLILEKLSDGKLTWTESVVIAEYYYKMQQEKNASN